MLYLYDAPEVTSPAQSAAHVVVLSALDATTVEILIASGVSSGGQFVELARSTHVVPRVDLGVDMQAELAAVMGAVYAYLRTAGALPAGI
jgi:hypothetical protein